MRIARASTHTYLSNPYGAHPTRKVQKASETQTQLNRQAEQRPELERETQSDDDENRPTTPGALLDITISNTLDTQPPAPGAPSSHQERRLIHPLEIRV